jgi:hypothetical protein
VFIPGLQDDRTIVVDDPSDYSQPSRPEAVIPGKPKRFKPEFAGLLLAFHMDMGWLIAVEALKKKRYGPGIPLTRGIQSACLPEPPCRSYHRRGPGIL